MNLSGFPTSKKLGVKNVREILFRGRVTDSGNKSNGQWVYGLYGQKEMGLPNMYHIITPNYLVPHVPDKTINYVDGNTVGQYTGMSDCDGNRVFEGDILLSKLGEYGIVEYFDNCFCVRRKDGIYCDLEYFQESYIVGNIHDNWEFAEKIRGGK